MKIQPELPNTNNWQPRHTASQTLQQAFSTRCSSVESSIMQRVQSEKEMNIDNFDSGAGIEDIFREELTKLCPSRYDITCGVVNDRDGNTAGDVDIVIFNGTWFPSVKSGASPQSRRVHFPVEGVYAVGEVKQTLNFSSLDSAMEKLVVCHRLNRPKTFARRIAENRESSSCSHGFSNPLYSFVVASSLEDGISLDDLANRFFDINKSLNRLEVVRCLCVLGAGTLIWCFDDHSKKESKPALFMMEDLYEPLYPVYYKQPQKDSALYAFMCNLHLHLFHSVLAAEDIALAYGPERHEIQRPTSADISLQPDMEWIEKLNIECNTDSENSCTIPKFADHVFRLPF